MATLPINASRKEKRAVVRFLWAKGLSASAIRAEMRPVYGDKCFARLVIERWLQKFSSNFLLNRHSETCFTMG
jgi:hypothetical protein